MMIFPRPLLSNQMAAARNITLGHNETFFKSILWHLHGALLEPRLCYLDFSSLSSCDDVILEIISKMRNGNDDFFTFSCEQPNGSSQKHHNTTNSHLSKLGLKSKNIFANFLNSPSDPSVFESSAK